MTRVRRSAHHQRRGVALAAAALLVTVLLAVTTAPAPAQVGESIPAPVTQLSADGLSATDGVRTLQVSQAAGLDPAGATIKVSGSGYDDFKGIYVAFCVIPPTNQQPTPCGGGATVDGNQGVSHWISSNPPAYGAGLALPYGPGGSFTVDVSVAPLINANIDCQRVRCAIVTRNDHSRTTDRSQDIFVPLTFGAAVATAPPPAPAPMAPAGPSGPATPTTVAPGDDVQPPPATTLADDGLSVTDGTRTLSITKADDLSPDGERVIVNGSGYDTTKGIDVAYCVVPEGDEAPSECESPTWVTATVPPGQLAFGPEGSFAVAMELAPSIGDVDCAASVDDDAPACAVVTRNDSTRPADRSQEILLPVAFAEPAPTTTQPADDAELVAAESSADDGGGGSAGLIVGAVVLAVVIGGGGSFLFVRRRAHSPA